MKHTNSKFRQNVLGLVKNIPRGRVMTYGQIAALCDSLRTARIVGGIAHHGDPSLPWQRVVNKRGGLASGYMAGGLGGHKAALEADGVDVSEDYYINIEKLIWWPGEHNS